MKAKLEKFQPLKGKDGISVLLTCSKNDINEIVCLFDQEVEVRRYIEESPSDIDTALDLTQKIQALMEELTWELAKIRLTKSK